MTALERWRLARSMTYRDLADALGLSSHMTAYRWCRGVRPRYARDALRVAGITGIAVSDLYVHHDLPSEESAA